MPKKIGNITLYSVDDLHENLGLSKLTIRNYLKSGKIKGKKLGVSWYVTEEALKAYFEDGLLQSQPEVLPKKEFTYTVQGINDLVSETEQCKTVEEAVQVLKNQPILSLFQVSIVDKSTKEVVETIRARDFLKKHDI